MCTSVRPSGSISYPFVVVVVVGGWCGVRCRVSHSYVVRFRLWCAAGLPYVP
jgi:hypothetical protein